MIWILMHLFQILMIDSVRSSLPPSSARVMSRGPSSARASRYSRAPSVSATARYSEDYRSAGRQARLEDTRITPGHYSYLSLRARTPSIDRQEAASKHLNFPKANLGTNNNLTILIKPRRKVGGSEAEKSDLLPVEVVAVGGKISKSPPREGKGGQMMSSRRLKQVIQSSPAASS